MHIFGYFKIFAKIKFSGQTNEFFNNIKPKIKILEPVNLINHYQARKREISRISIVINLNPSSIFTTGKSNSSAKYQNFKTFQNPNKKTTEQSPKKTIILYKCHLILRQTKKERLTEMALEKGGLTPGEETTENEGATTKDKIEARRTQDAISI